jgi:hypothetical protein
MAAFAIVSACSSGSPVSGSDASTDDASNADAGCGAPTVDPEVITKGAPSWKLAELAIYHAPVGSTVDNGAEANQSLDAVFTPKHVFDTQLGLMKSAEPHDPPYDTEVATGLVQAGFQNSGCVSMADLVAPSGILISMNLVPSASAKTAKSFEQPGGGPVISFALLNIDGDLYQGTTLVDPNFDSAFPAAGAVYGDLSIGGYAHLLLNWGENQAVSPNPLTPGSYSLQIALDDGSNATKDVVHFVVQ